MRVCALMCGLVWLMRAHMGTRCLCMWPCMSICVCVFVCRCVCV